MSALSPSNPRFWDDPAPKPAKTPCAYSTHSSPARRVLVLTDGSRFPMCWSHRQGDIRNFDHWEALEDA